MNHLVKSIATIIVAVSMAACQTTGTSFPRADSRAKDVNFPSVPFVGKPVEVSALLQKPKGKGPFPAVLVLHTLGGLQPHVTDDWPELLVANGYVALTIDHYGSRDIEPDAERDITISLPARRGDVIGAIKYLGSLSYVFPNRIGAIGFSAGGATSLAMSLKENESDFTDAGLRPFKAAVGVYPACFSAAPEFDSLYINPVLMILGELDNWSPADMCKSLISELHPKSAPVKIEVMKGAHHGFDVDRSRTVQEFTLEGNADATAKARALVKRFFDQHL